jgi:hypothetical protein
MHSAFGNGQHPATLGAVNILRCLLLTLLAISLAACSSRRSKSHARIYEGDSSPGISMQAEVPGSPVGGE